MKHMYILIDDLRDINKLTNDTVNAAQKLTLRTFEQGMNFVKHTNLTDITLLMDNDLGDVVGKEGSDILSHAMDHRNYPYTIVLVTSNPVGNLKMTNMIMASKQYKKIGNIFMRLDTCT
ncbi:hypothetical protein VPHK567_0363 [Vibrio phage K567]|nr:hypothetical protein MYOV011v1_p0257 [Vibrio phage 6E35.1a]